MKKHIEMLELSLPYKLNLQMFADGGGEGASNGASIGGQNNNATGGEGQSTGGSEGEKGKDSKTFTQDDVNRIIQDRLAKERQKWEKEFQTKLDEAKTEAEKLAKMNAEQKAEYERQKREQELAKREAEITRRELRATALETLAEKGLPKQLADILDYTDAESTNKSIESVEKVFREAVEVAVNERLKGGAPKGSTGGGNSAIPDAEKIKQIFNKR